MDATPDRRRFLAIAPEHIGIGSVTVVQNWLAALDGRQQNHDRDHPSHLRTAMIGTTLGPYRVLDKLGGGGMGEVYRARDTRLDRDVAVKVLPAHLSTDTEALARFEREAKAVAALSHPNILAIDDVGTADGVA